MALPLLLFNWNTTLAGGTSQIVYLLRDDFNDTLAAGSVNGTAATPGPGTRTVVDTNNRISVGSGVLTMSGATAAQDRLVYDSLARTAGRIFLFRIPTNTSHATNNTDVIGLSTSATTAGTGYGIDMNTSATSFMVRDATTPVSGIYTRGNQTVPWWFAIVMRGTGAYHFYKSADTSNQWYLLWISVAGNAVMYPKMITTSANSKIWTADNFRIPLETWLPTPLAYDTFTRANGAIGSTETTGPDSQACTARAYTNQSGTWTVSSNTAVCDGTGIVTVNCGTINVIHEAKVTRSGNNAGIVLRYAGANDYVVAYLDGTNANLDKVTTAGGTTSVIQAAVTYSAGAVLRVIADSTSFSLFYNNVQIGTTQTINDATLQTGTAHGLYTTNAGNSFDIMQTFANGNGGEYAALNKWSA